jgi:hypothetical protein
MTFFTFYCPSYFTVGTTVVVGLYSNIEITQLAKFGSAFTFASCPTSVG